MLQALFHPLLDDINLFCFMIKCGKSVGVTRIQKTIYLCQYAGLKISDYKFNQYGPFSYWSKNMLKITMDERLATYKDDGTSERKLTAEGHEYYRQFVSSHDDSTVRLAETIIEYLNNLDDEELVLVTSLDYIEKRGKITGSALVDKICLILNHCSSDVENAYVKLQALREIIEFQKH